MMDQAREKTSQLASQAREKGSQIAHQAREKTGQLAAQAREQASHLGEAASQQAQHVRQAFGQYMHDNPLAVGAMAIAVGMAVGFTLPRTRKEDELMGEKRDELLEKAKESGRDTLEKVEQVASQATSAAKQEAQEQKLY
jgi:ElaB/YqjD/DUF883 family membrane-anchored ribosome-binding protein